MKGIVSDFIVGSHNEKGLTGCLKRRAMDFAMRGRYALAQSNARLLALYQRLSDKGG